MGLAPASLLYSVKYNIDIYIYYLHHISMGILNKVQIFTFVMRYRRYNITQSNNSIYHRRLKFLKFHNIPFGYLVLFTSAPEKY